MTGKEIYGRVAGPKSFTAGLYASMEENGILKQMEKMVENTVLKCRGQ